MPVMGTPALFVSQAAGNESDFDGVMRNCEEDRRGMIENSITG